MAFNWIECGKYSSMLRPGGGIEFSLLENRTDIEAVERPFRELAEERTGSVDAYCDSPFQQQTNEDSSLFYLLAFLLLLWPGASLAQLYVLVTGMLSIGIALIGYAVWRWTRSVILSVGIVVAAAFWHSQLARFGIMTNHMFGWIFLLFTVFLMAWLVAEASSGTMRRAALIAVVTGLTAAFAANMRSTVQIEIPFLVLATAIGVMSATPPDPERWWRSRKLRHAIVLLSLMGIGWFTYGELAIRPYEAVNDGGLTNHPVAHVLVIGLAVPPNDLAREEGILWLDSRGLEIAERYRPGSTATMKQYNDALFDYYFDLWRDRPGDMFRTYMGKAKITGTSLFPHARNFGIGWISPLILIQNGIALGLILILVATYSFMLSIGSPAGAFLLRALGISLVGGYLISLVIFPMASLYIPEFPFTFILLTVVFWWASGRLALSAAIHYRITTDGWLGGKIRTAHQWW